MSLTISVVQVVGCRIIKVNCELYEAQTENTGVEINVLLRLAGDCRYVVESFEPAGDILGGTCSETSGMDVSFGVPISQLQPCIGTKWLRCNSPGATSSM